MIGDRATPPIEHEARERDLVEERFVTPAQSRPNALSLRSRVPVGRGRHRGGERAEANEYGILAVPLADELAHVELSSLAHLRRPSIAEVRVVLPHDDLGVLALTAEVRDERVE